MQSFLSVYFAICIIASAEPIFYDESIPEFNPFFDIRLELNGNYNALMDYLNAINVPCQTWARGIIETAMHVKENPSFAQLPMSDIKCNKGVTGIAIEYRLENANHSLAALAIDQMRTVKQIHDIDNDITFDILQMDIRHDQNAMNQGMKTTGNSTTHPIHSTAFDMFEDISERYIVGLICAIIILIFVVVRVMITDNKIGENADEFSQSYTADTFCHYSDYGHAQMNEITEYIETVTADQQQIAENNHDSVEQQQHAENDGDSVAKSLNKWKSTSMPHPLFKDIGVNAVLSQKQIHSNNNDIVFHKDKQVQTCKYLNDEDKTESIDLIPIYRKAPTNIEHMPQPIPVMSKKKRLKQWLLQKINAFFEPDYRLLPKHCHPV